VSRLERADVSEDVCKKYKRESHTIGVQQFRVRSSTKLEDPKHALKGVSIGRYFKIQYLGVRIM
jgi:hypothetical protein